MQISKVWICICLELWICGLLELWICGVLDCWICDLFDFWIFIFLDCWIVGAKVNEIDKRSFPPILACHGHTSQRVGILVLKIVTPLSVWAYFFRRPQMPLGFQLFSNVFLPKTQKSKNPKTQKSKKSKIQKLKQTQNTNLINFEKSEKN